MMPSILVKKVGVPGYTNILIILQRYMNFSVQLVKDLSQLEFLPLQPAISFIFMRQE